MRAFVLACLLLATTTRAATLDIALEGIEGDSGHIHVAVIAGQAGWDHEAAPVAERDVELAGATTPLRARFDGLAPGRYAVEAYQDVNANGRLDFNFMRIPKEPVGSSRNPEVWRRPHFDECVFELPAAGTAITIELR